MSDYYWLLQVYNTFKCNFIVSRIFLAIFVIISRLVHEHHWPEFSKCVKKYFAVLFHGVLRMAEAFIHCRSIYVIEKEPLVC